MVEMIQGHEILKIVAEYERQGYRLESLRANLAGCCARCVWPLLAVPRETFNKRIAILCPLCYEKQEAARNMGV